MIIGSDMMVVYNHRLELIKELLKHKHKVYILTPYGEEEENLKRIGATCIDIKIENRGKNPFQDLKLLKTLISSYKKYKPDVILTFYTKTNIYGGLAARICKIPYIENITGLGSFVSNGGIMAKVMMDLYKQAVKKSHIVFFQNTQNQNFFHQLRIPMKKEKLLPGSGVSLERFKPLPYPENTDYQFVFISRILKEKGIYEYVEAAEIIKKKYPNTTFHVIGPYNHDFDVYLKNAQDKGIVKVHGKVFNVSEYIRDSHCTIFPSYYGEGMANVLLESAASARPIITTNYPGCGETVEDGKTGFIVEPMNTNDLVNKIQLFINLDLEEKKQMGLAGREKMEKEFDRRIVINAYMKEIDSIITNK